MEQIVLPKEKIQDSVEMFRQHSHEGDEERIKKEILNYLLDEESGFEV